MLSPRKRAMAVILYELGRAVAISEGIIPAPYTPSGPKSVETLKSAEKGAIGQDKLCELLIQAETQNKPE